MRAPRRPGRRRGRCASARISSGVPLASSLPKSRTWMRSQTRITRSMSCSTSRTAVPPAASSVRTAANRSVSWSSWPEAGSSSSSTFGSRARQRASSTMRPVPVDSESARTSARSPRSSRSISASVAADTLAGLAAGPGADRDPDVLPHGEAAEQLEALEGAAQAPLGPGVGGEAVERRCRRAAPSRPGPRCTPVITLNRVVLPAPFGPISPVTAPAGASSDTSSSAVWPPKRTVTCCGPRGS